jgi:adenosylcobinamide-phosphate synthase
MIGPDEARLGDALSLLLIAVLADAVLAGLPGLRDVLRAPAFAVRGLAGWCDARLNRPHRSEAARRIRGILVILVIAGAAWAAGFAVERLVRAEGAWPGLEAVVLLFLLWHRAAFDLARAVAARLRAGDESGARAALARLSPSDAAAPDAYSVARAAIEAEARGFGAGVVGVTLWYVAFGLPGAVLFRAVHEASLRIGQGAAPGAAFGAAAFRLDSLLGLIPAPVAGTLLALAAIFVPRANPLRGFRVMIRDFAKHGSPLSGWTFAAVAGALGLALAGPRRGAPDEVPPGWIGDGRARAEPADVGRASYLFAVAGLIHIGLLAGAFALLRAAA